MLEKLKEALYKPDMTDEKSLSFICQALVRHNQKGFDYLELKLALAEMHKIGITGEVAMNSALATANAMGIDKAALLHSLDRYIQLLQQERMDFDKALTDAMTRKVESRQKEIAQLQSHISRLEEEQERIRQNITLAREKINEHQHTLEEASTELTKAEAAFTKTFQAVIEAMQADRSKF